MNKTELVAAMAESADLSKKDAEKALKAFIEAVTDELKKDDFLYVVPDFRLNKVQQLENLLQKDMDKVEFLCNECCFIGCLERKKCYLSLIHI